MFITLMTTFFGDNANGVRYEMLHTCLVFDVCLLHKGRLIMEHWNDNYSLRLHHAYDEMYPWFVFRVY